MDNSHKRGIETRQRNEAARKERRMKEEREVRAQIEALRKVRDDPNPHRASGWRPSGC